MSAFGDSLFSLFNQSYNGDNKIDTDYLTTSTKQYIDRYKQSKIDFFKNYWPNKEILLY